MFTFVIFLNHSSLIQRYRSYCCHLDIGIGVGMGVTLSKFTSKLFYVMDKVLSGKVSYMQTSLVLNEETTEFLEINVFLFEICTWIHSMSL